MSVYLFFKCHNVIVCHREMCHHVRAMPMSERMNCAMRHPRCCGYCGCRRCCCCARWCCFDGYR